MKIPAMPRESLLGKVLKFASMYGTSSWITKSSQLPVAEEFTYHELPSGVFISITTKINYRITLRRRLVIASREIDQHLPYRIGASFIVGDIFRSHFSGYDLAFCRSGKGRKHAQKTN